MAGKAMIVSVKVRKEGIKTQHNRDGGPALMLDVADLTSGQIYLDVMWMNPTIVDQWTPYVGKAIPVKLNFQPSSSGGNPYLMPEPLADQELAYATSWCTNNPDAFDRERASRQSLAQAVQLPGTSATPPAPAAPAVPQAPAAKPFRAEPPATPVQPQAPAAAPVPVAAAGGPNAPTGITPEMQALMQAIQNGQIPGQQ
jgi:hypothetical protein